MNWINSKYRLNFRRPETDIFIRFREIPPFRTDGIRKITLNQLELKKMTAHDYEDMLLVGGVLVM
jgi:hypothetical protein